MPAAFPPHSPFSVRPHASPPLLAHRARLNQIMEGGSVHMLIAEDVDLHRVVGFGTVVCLHT